ncbi:SusC/RagA family TonB-linked outer membrane protein [Arenibacter aquaticus]|uniref:SusC/RagA family TonB-linked outer membrane protein n=1 Tax=Arenibacter aquaticus TaxID=2489054 RepID=A0A3S0CR27_9FLAO|nr:TonB-dependent receptor [Arenibacter aquaticus]RTE55088.1 SusC/RagA family TonB-linked outer membrane protein [Arenibacter aquaticus]
MKKPRNTPEGWKYLFPQLNLKMKLSLLFLFTTILQLQAGLGYAQKTKITLNMSKASVLEVINEIESISEFKFFYSKGELNLNREVDIQVKQQPLGKVLKSLFFNSKVDYKIIDRQVVLKASKAIQPTTQSVVTPKVVQFQVSGTIIDTEGMPLPGASIVEKGTSNGTQTDFDGNFDLAVKDQNAVLVVSYLGFSTKEVSLAGQSQLNITLEESAAGLDEVVVVGFGTQKSSKVISAVAQVTNEQLNIEERPVTSVQGALLGAVPGLKGSFGSGSPGATPNLSIRGTSTLNNASLLVIIDGFEGSLTDINPQSIESVSVLKDAAAVAVYGARGANGVLLVTTKNTSRNEKVSVAYNMSNSIQTPSRLPGLLNSMELMEFSNVAAGEGNEIFGEDVLQLARENFYPDTNWADALYKDLAVQQSHNLSIVGGSEKTGYLIGAGYLDQEGLSLGSDEFKRLNLRIKVDTDVTDWLTTGINALISNRKTTSVPIAGSANVRGLPFYPVTSVDGLWVDKGNPGEVNPVAQAASGSFNEVDKDAINLQLYAKIKPFKNLVFEERVSIIKENQNTRNWTNVYDYVTFDFTDPDSYTNPDSANRTYVYGSPEARSLTLTSEGNYNFRTLSTLNYNLDSDVHSLGVLLGFQSETGEYEMFRAGRTGFLLDNVIDLSLGEIADPTIGGGLGTTSSRGGNETTLSYFGRVTYDYKSRYLMEASFRVDGSSFFLDNNRYGFFPAVSVGWNVAKEPFFSNVEFVDQFKLRASYGVSGDDSGVGASSIQLVNLNVSGYPIGGEIAPSLVLGSTSSQDLKWETATTLNLGLDASIWKGKLQFSAEYFNSNREDILDFVVTPTEFGFGSVPANLYSARSWGWEFSATHKNKIGDVNYWVSANISDYDNEITDVAGNETIDFAVGQSISDRLGYVTDGFFDSQDEIDGYVGADGTTVIDQSNVGGAYVGGFKYIDQPTIDTDGDGVMDTGDGAITADDRVIIDKNSAVNLNFGLNLGLQYKGLTLSARFYGALDNNQWWSGADAHEPFLGSGNAYSFQLDYWSPDNPNALFPTPQGTGIQGYTSGVTHFIQDNEYIKLQNVTLSYDFGKKLLDRISFVDKLNLVLSLENVGTIWTNSPAYDYGWDPELGVGLLDYPLPMTTSLGLNVRF